MEKRQLTRQQKTDLFNPDSFGNTGGNIFGLPYTIEESDVVIIPVPWDVTVSSGEGTANGPKNVFQESFQIDLYDECTTDPWKAGIAMEDFPEELYLQGQQLRAKARDYISYLEKHGSVEGIDYWENIKKKINQAQNELFEKTRTKSLRYLENNKLPVLLGGDHSTSLGLISALSEKNPQMGILQIDAHADLRPEFEGFIQSHASIMYNAMTYEQISRLVQVGIRDLCNQEVQWIKNNPHRVTSFFSRDISRRLLEGEPWKNITNEIIEVLPQKVYISFDVDGLEPAFCPSTGTPVPGGLGFYQALYLIEKLVEKGKTIIGFDLVETGAGKTDGIVSCRLLYRIIALMLKSNHRIP